MPIPPILGKTQAAEQAAIDRLKAQHYTDKLPVPAAYSAAALNGYGSPHPVRVQAPKAASANPDNSFDWGDAAIGAAAGLSLTLLVGGGAMLLSRRRSPQGDTRQRRDHLSTEGKAPIISTPQSSPWAITDAEGDTTRTTPRSNQQ